MYGLGVHFIFPWYVLFCIRGGSCPLLATGQKMLASYVKCWCMYPKKSQVTVEVKPNFPNELHHYYFFSIALIKMKSLAYRFQSI